MVRRYNEKTMAWQNILGHDRIVEKFRRAARRDRLAGSFLFVGPSGIGKRHFAVALAKTLLCKALDPEAFLPCGTCDSCRLFHEDGGISHPDFFSIVKPADKTQLPLELLVGDKEHRGKAGLCFEISRTPYMGGKKIAVIDDADYLNAEAANAMLKTLEEPPRDSLLILLGSSAAKQLPTIRSRCRIIRFQALSARHLASILQRLGLVESLEKGLRLAHQSDGSVETAKELTDASLEPQREQLLQLLKAKPVDSVTGASQINAFVDAGGKEASLRRRRLRFVLLAAVDFFREQMRQGESNDRQRAIRQTERTLEALEQIERNANVPFIIDAWLESVGRSLCR